MSAPSTSSGKPDPVLAGAFLADVLAWLEETPLSLGTATSPQMLLHLGGEKKEEEMTHGEQEHSWNEQGNCTA